MKKNRRMPHNYKKQADYLDRQLTGNSSYWKKSEFKTVCERHYDVLQDLIHPYELREFEQ